MCYEVLIHSAAEAFLRSARRERLQAQQGGKIEDPVFLGSVVSDTASVAKEIDWVELSRATAQAVKRFHKLILWGLVAIATLGIIRLLSSTETWFFLIGTRLSYSVPPKISPRYFISFHYDLNTWTEKQGRLDTPLPHWRVDELGNVFLEKAKGSSAKDPKLTIRPQEWIQIVYRGDVRQSQAFPLSHPSLTPVSVGLDRHGFVVQRKFQLSPRLAKGVDFLVPRFPKGFLKKGRTWAEPIQWIETIGEWKIHWSGKFHWTLMGQQDCEQDTCTQLFYKAELHPKIWEAPRWATGAIGRPSFTGATTGNVFFNNNTKRLYSNDLKSDGILRIPLSNVGLVPRKTRVGRKVLGPGEIVLQFSNRVSIK
ncbi:MAG: hypothetical protein WC859_04760 [Elusimicrobiota bacterium]|jgi:hypothetical protein